MKPGWAEVALGEICEFRYGKALKAGDRSGTGFDVYGSNGPIGKHEQALTDGPTIVIGRKGSYGEVHYASRPVWPIDTTYYVDGSATACDLRWLAHRLADLGLTHLNRAAAVPGLNREDAYRQRLLLPPHDEQSRIARMLDGVTQRVAAVDRKLELIDELLDASYIRLFGSPAGQHGFERELLGNIADVITGNTPSRSDPKNYGDFVPWIKNDDVGRSGPYVSSAAEHLSEAGVRKARTVGPGAVLVTCISGSPGAIGRVGLTTQRVAFNQQINAAVPRELDARFLYAQLRLSRERIRRLSTGGMKGLISKSALRRLEVDVPSPSSQQQFAMLFDAAQALRSNVVSACSSFRELRDSLVERAFAGELS